MNSWIKYLLTLLPYVSCAQSFAPEPGVLGSTAIHADSSIIINWASNVQIKRGALNVQNPGMGSASYGFESDAEGYADGLGVVSLGDSGIAIITLSPAVYDGIGPDFAIFENGFTDGYMEFAFVEVSSDGINFFRFPATSETPTDVQINNFTISDCRYVNNLAGKYRATYGTPFDLAELSSISGLDIQNITHIKLIDVIGSIDPQWGSMDQYGHLINDPYPTPFESGGFDLDGVGIIHQKVLGIKDLQMYAEVTPNPFHDQIKITAAGDFQYSLYSTDGTLVSTDNATDFCYLQVSHLENGVYFLELRIGENIIIKQLVK